jgi:hypothetical protein
MFEWRLLTHGPRLDQINDVKVAVVPQLASRELVNESDI